MSQMLFSKVDGNQKAQNQSIFCAHMKIIVAWNDMRVGKLTKMSHLVN